jgi:hypothetical protein
VNDGRVTTSGNPSAIAEAVNAFFAEHEVASLRLPSGGFGRPHDNWHRLTETVTQGDDLLIRLDGSQVLTVAAEDSSLEGRVLRVTIRGGRWRWTAYGADDERKEVLGPGVVEFHARFHR